MRRPERDEGHAEDRKRRAHGHRDRCPTRHGDGRIGEVVEPLEQLHREQEPSAADEERAEPPPRALSDHAASSIPLMANGTTTRGMTGMTMKRKQSAMPVMAAMTAASFSEGGRPHHRPIPTPARRSRPAATNTRSNAAVAGM